MQIQFKLGFIIILSSHIVMGQDHDVDFVRLDETIDVVMIDSKPEIKLEFADPSIDQYLHLMDSIDAKTLKPTGYRVQVFSASGPNAKSLAFEKQAELLQLFGETKSYTIWNYPNWVIRIGNFRTRLEALQFHGGIKSKYPASFIIKDEIEIKHE